MNSLVFNNFNMVNVNFCSQQSAQKSIQMPDVSQYWLNSSQSSPLLSSADSESIGVNSSKINFNNLNPDMATNATGTAVLLRGVQWLIEKTSEFCARILMRGKEFASATDVERVAQTMKQEKGLGVNIHFIDNGNKGFLKSMFPSLGKELDVVANGANAFYTNQGNFAVAPKSKPSLMLHELGHAINFEKSKLFRGLQKLKVLGMFAPMALAFLNDITGKRKDGKESFIERNAGVIGFSAFLPTIIEEAAASIRGIKAAKKVLPNVKLGPLKRNYFFAWMTYVLAGLGVGVASKLAISERKIPKQAS